LQQERCVGRNGAQAALIGGHTDEFQRVIVSWLADILEQPFFDQLRTEEQAGYIVQCYSSTAGGVVSLIFAAQSEWHPASLEERILNFVAWAWQHVAELPTDELEEHRQGLIDGWLETCVLAIDTNVLCRSHPAASKRWTSASTRRARGTH
jgi:secreted Zn-dependent insulinase-like peptidase